MIPELLQPFDAVVFRRGIELKRYASVSDDPTVRAQALRDSFDDSNKLGDPVTILVGDGTFDGLDKPFILPGQDPENPSKVAGLDKERTILKGSAPIGDYVSGLNWQLQNTIVEDLTLINDYDKEEGGVCAGFRFGPSAATLRRCNLWCPVWTVYTWSNQVVNTITIEDCNLTTGRVAIASESSGLGQNITIRRSRIFGDSYLAHSGGAVSHPVDGGVFGVVHRGGLLKVEDTEFYIIGGGLPRAASITDHGGGNDEPSGDNRVELWNVRSSVSQSGQPIKYYDLDFFYQQTINGLKQHNCRGSYPTGRMRVSW